MSKARPEIQQMLTEALIRSTENYHQWLTSRLQEEAKESDSPDSEKKSTSQNSQKEEEP